MKEIEGKYFNPYIYNKFTNYIINAKIKQKELINLIFTG